MNESDTRAELIDPLLKLAGWGVVAESRIQREYNINNGEIKARANDQIILHFALNDDKKCCCCIKLKICFGIFQWF